MTPAAPDGPERDLIGYGRNAPQVRWPDGARVAVSLVVNWEEGSEPSIPSGDGRNVDTSEVPTLPSEYRDLGAESVWEYGSRAGVWRLARMFDEYDIKTTLFACGRAFECNPEVGAWVREGGHEPAGHGYRWEKMWLMDREQEREQLHRCVAAIEQACGERPRGWYSRYSPSVNTRELLVEEGGFVYDCDSYADDLPYFTQVSGNPHLVVPYSLVYNDGRFLTPMGYGTPNAFLDHCTRALDLLWDEGATHPKMMSIGLHPRVIGQAARASALKEFIEYALAKGDVWFARRLDIAQWWKAHHEEFAA